jgi:7-cyano-7-deazaguanine synthase
MAITVVPNRNAILLSISYGVAVAEGAEVVATGVHAGDHFVYPDCRPEFIKAFDEMQKTAVEGFGDGLLRLYAPFVEWSKADIVARRAPGWTCRMPTPGAAMRGARFIAGNAELASSGEKPSNSRACRIQPYTDRCVRSRVGVV